MDILETIDHTLADCDISIDAMRWMPDVDDAAELDVELDCPFAGALRHMVERVLADANARDLYVPAGMLVQLGRVGIVTESVEQSLSDSRERALELRRHRNTGPPSQRLERLGRGR